MERKEHFHIISASETASGSFPILPPTHWSKPYWRVPEGDPGSLFCTFLRHKVIFFIFLGRHCLKNFNRDRGVPVDGAIIG
jgi:hypothetical protein